MNMAENHSCCQKQLAATLTNRAKAGKVDFKMYKLNLATRAAFLHGARPVCPGDGSRTAE